MGEQKAFYRRHLPHYQPEDATFHVVFRLAGSLPFEIIEEMRNERAKARRLLEETKNQSEKRELLRKQRWEYFQRFDLLLACDTTGPQWLKEAKIAELVKESIHYRDGKVYDLLAYSIMPNHVHMVLELVGRVADPTLEDNAQPKSLIGRDSVNPESSGGRDSVPSYRLTTILTSLKKYTALKANRILRRSGAFWQNESYDHMIRDDRELDRTIWYILQNPVQTGMVKSWELWPWNYCKWSLL